LTKEIAIIVLLNSINNRYGDWESLLLIFTMLEPGGEAAYNNLKHATYSKEIIQVFIPNVVV